MMRKRVVNNVELEKATFQGFPEQDLREKREMKCEHFCEFY